MVTHGTVLCSNHCPIIIQCDPRMITGRRLFRFQAFWAKKEECQRLVEAYWTHPRGGAILDRSHK